ncbi:MAG: hypothetical protein SXA11_13260 [Cyanobacteriota bacterium]|nr:hypothetical protein [Cyanobacteriota bacterium]
MLKNGVFLEGDREERKNLCTELQAGCIGGMGRGYSSLIKSVGGHGCILLHLMKKPGFLANTFAKIKNTIRRLGGA